MNRIDLEGRFAIVTGGARGLGYAIAERMLESGAAVSLWDIDAERLESASTALQRLGSVHAAAMDLSCPDQVQAAMQATLDGFGQLDIIVNNAGITGGNAPSWELAPDVWQRVMDVNLFGPFLVCRAAIPHMLDSGYGRIVNIASVAGKEGNPNAAHYSASKAGLIALSKSMGKELARRNVLVNCVTPAAARTEIFAQMKKEQIDYMLSKIPMNRFLEPQEVAAMVCWLASEDCSFTTGAAFDLSGGRATY